MSIFINEKQEIISAHLDHVLKSYYYTTSLSVSAYNMKGDLLGSSKENSEDVSTLFSSCAQKFLKENRNHNFSERDTLLLELESNVYTIIAPIIHNHTFLCFLMTEPFFIGSLQSSEKKFLYEKTQLSFSLPINYHLYCKFPSIENNRLNYLGQLFFHLASDGIYIGKQHLEPTSKMTETRWGKSLPLESLGSGSQFMNLSVIEEVAYALEKNDLNKALEIYSSYQVFQTSPLESICPFHILRYQCVGFTVLLQFIMTNHHPDLRTIFSHLTNEAIYNLHQSTNFSQLITYNETLLENYANEIKSHDQRQLSPPIIKALHYIHEHYSTPIKLSTVANFIPMNESYLSSLFKIENGVSFKHYLNSYRIKQAIRLMKLTNDSITDIALSVGFENTNYFSTVFKQYTGVSPSKYFSHQKLL